MKGIWVSATDLDGRFGLYCSVITTGTYQSPEKLELAVPNEAQLTNPAISPDESFLVFSSGDLGGEGASDLFITYKNREGEWSEPKNLGAGINSAFSDFAPSVSPDGKYLYFTSERSGVVKADEIEGRPPGDIYRVKLQGR